MTTSDPIKEKPYSLPHAMRETLNKEIDNMLAMGVIEESCVAYESPVVMVKKPDRSTRVCIDYRKLNSATVFYPEPMPTAEEIFAKLAEDQYFSMFNLSNGYWQVPILEKNRDVCTFNLSPGTLSFPSNAFGLINAPATFSRLMRNVLRNNQGLDSYLDDVHEVGVGFLVSKRGRKALLGYKPVSDRVMVARFCGERLLEFALEHDMIICNTKFQQKNCKKWT